MKCRVRVVSAALSSCIICSNKRYCLTLKTWILLSWWWLSLSWLSVSHGKMINKAWPSKTNAIIWDKRELLCPSLLLLCTAQVGCFPSMMIKGEVYFPFCTWKGMFSRFTLSLLLLPWDLRGLTRRQRTLTTRCAAECSFYSGSSCLLAAHLQGAPGRGVVRLAHNVLNKTKKRPRDTAYCSSELCVQQQPLTVLEFMFSLNSHHHLWLFRCIFYRLLFLCTRSSFPGAFLRYIFGICSFLLSPKCPQRPVYAIWSGMCVFFTRFLFLNAVPCFLQGYLCSDLFRGSRGYHATEKQAQHLLHASALPTGAHIWNRYLGFSSMKTRALGWQGWGE